MEHSQYNVYQILQPNESPSEGFKIGRTLDDGVRIAKANLKVTPNAEGLTVEEVQVFIKENYPQPEIDF